MFTEVVGAVAILSSGGVFYQKPLYKASFNNRVFAKWGSGYIRLGAGDATSNPKVSFVCSDSILRISETQAPTWDNQCPR